MKIKNITVIENFKNMVGAEPHIFGEYYVEWEDYRSLLIIQHNNEWRSVNHFINETISEGVSLIREERINEIKHWLKVYEDIESEVQDEQTD